MAANRPAAGLSPTNTVAYLLCALFVAVAADLGQPVGSMILFLTSVFALLAVISGLLSLIPPLRSVMLAATSFAVIAAMVFVLFAGLQRYAVPKERGEAYGFLAASLSPIRAFQRFILAESDKRKDLLEDLEEEGAPPTEAAAPATSGERAMRNLFEGINSPDPAQRIRVAVETLNHRSSAVVAAAADALYRADDPALRQLAIRKLLAQRRNARLPLIVIPTDGASQALAAALQDKGLTIKTMNEASGAFEGTLCGLPGMSGTVNRTGVTLSGNCRVGSGDAPVVFTLRPMTDYRLAGEARSGVMVTQVELPLN